MKVGEADRCIICGSESTRAIELVSGMPWGLCHSCTKRMLKKVVERITRDGLRKGDRGSMDEIVKDVYNRMYIDSHR